MIINSTPDNIATLGNVAQVSEFKIRNSAKAFGILSSGLYANKIRAIIRELGCNAVDSHVAAKSPMLRLMFIFLLNCVHTFLSVTTVLDSAMKML